MLDMHTPLTLNSRQWFSIGAAAYVLTDLLAYCTALCAAGSGRRVGENCEQLWAQLRPLLKLTRYMTKDAYFFCLDDALLLVAEGKLSSFVQFMTQQQAAMEAKLSKCPHAGLWPLP